MAEKKAKKLDNITSQKAIDIGWSACDFDSDFRLKIMHISWLKPCTLKSTHDVSSWKNEWLAELRKWHSPYKVVVDLENLHIINNPQVKTSIQKMITFMEKFYLRKIVAYGDKSYELPFKIVKSKDEALLALGIRGHKAASTRNNDLRSQLVFDNHFQQQFIEFTCSSTINLATKEHLTVFKSKLMNNLMLWHSSWSLLIDCHNLQIAVAIQPQFVKLISFLQRLFMHAIIGYNANSKNEYPFLVYRTRHRAMTKIEKSTETSGDVANCQTADLRKNS